MNGISISTESNFQTLFKPIIDRFDSLYWLVDHQSTAIDPLWIFAGKENQHRYDRVLVDCPMLNNTSTQLWRPGTLPELASHVKCDEWTYFTGIEANESAINRLVGEFFTANPLGRRHFQLIWSHAAIFSVYVDGWWEIYSTRLDWITRLKQAWHTTDIDSVKWHN